MMRSLLLVGFAVISLQSTTATASDCYLGPFVAPIDTPSGCPLYAWHHAAEQPAPPAVHVMRNGQMVNVAGTIEKTTTTLGVEWPEYDCKGVVTGTSTTDEAYDMYRVQITGALVGEQLIVDGQMAGRYAASGSCIQPIDPLPVCSQLPPPCPGVGEGEDTDGGGCDAGGGNGALAFGLFALGLVLARARR